MWGCFLDACDVHFVLGPFLVPRGRLAMQHIFVVNWPRKYDRAFHPGPRKGTCVCPQPDDGQAIYCLLRVLKTLQRNSSRTVASVGTGASSEVVRSSNRRRQSPCNKDRMGRASLVVFQIETETETYTLNRYEHGDMKYMKPKLYLWVPFFF